MKDLTLSVAGKTFLLGEYLAIVGGPSLLVATAPRFEMSVAESREPVPVPFAGASPAGRWVQRHQNLFTGRTFRFQDPHGGLGGLGASSAQFALVYAWTQPQFLDSGFCQKEDVDWRALLSEYRAVSWSGEGLAPSGADVVAQLRGGLTEWNGLTYRARTHRWAFAKLKFTLLRTGAKLATHEHLRVERADLPKEALHEQVLKGLGALESSNETLFCEAVSGFARELEESGRLAVRTKDILVALAKRPEVRAAKGCGAMGADVVLVLHNEGAQAQILEFAKQNALLICGTSDDLTSGLQVVESPPSPGVEKEQR